ncbi:MAG: translocase, partial [Planctomycetaceae bacterium]|nr:translocase [Planctomycetaceae bacterium]
CWMPPDVETIGKTEINNFLERALFVGHRYERDRHYVVRDGKVQIVDEYTGRIQPGRTWNDGIHQAVEAREGTPLTVETGHLARVTMQEYVRRFPYLGGMTGTAREATRELRSVYGLPVRTIPPNRRLRRERLADAVFLTRDEKWRGVVAETQQMLAQERSVLIGTPTIASSQVLAEVCHAAGISCVVLNALNPEQEAEVVAQAGEPGRVTIATNMAGRGTDIRLSDSVRKAGGLHVIATELHTASRIDRQLEGRCGRQGDPGSYRQYLALDDEILSAAHGSERAAQVVERHRRSADGSVVARLLRDAQRTLEQEHWRQRQELMQFDEELQRATIALGLDPVLDAVGG